MGSLRHPPAVDGCRASLAEPRFERKVDEMGVLELAGATSPRRHETTTRTHLPYLTSGLTLLLAWSHELRRCGRRNKSKATVMRQNAAVRLVGARPRAVRNLSLPAIGYVNLYFHWDYQEFNISCVKVTGAYTICCLILTCDASWMADLISQSGAHISALSPRSVVTKALAESTGC
jgi:hypothetical protein